MKILFRQNVNTELPVEADLAPLNLKDAIEKTRQALEVAYSGFDNAVDVDIIDSYIYEINSLQKRYRHLTELAAKEIPEQEVPAKKSSLYPHSPIRALVSHVLS